MDWCGVDNESGGRTRQVSLIGQLLRVTKGCAVAFRQVQSTILLVFSTSDNPKRATDIANNKDRQMNKGVEVKR